MDQKQLRDQLAKTAASQRLSLTPDELDTFSAQMPAVLRAFDELDQIDTDGVPPSHHPVAVPLALRADAVKPSTAPTQNHAKKENGYLVGPRMMK